MPGTGVTPSAANTRALVICGVVSHIPPVGPSGSLSSSVTLNASRVPVFWTSRAKSLYSAGFIVAGPVLSTVSSGVPGGIGGKTNSPTSPELLIVPPSLVMNSEIGLPLLRKLICNV